MRDITLADTIYILFTTRAFATGIPTTLAGSPVLSIYEENNLTQITAGVSVSVDYDSVTGLNQATIVATGANGYENGKSYSLIITTGTVGGVSVVGEVVGEFTIGSSAAAVDLANGTDGLGALKSETALIVADTNEMQGKLPTNKFMGSSDGADDDGTLNNILTDTGTTLDDHLTDIKGTGFIKDTDSLTDVRIDVTGLNGDAMRGTNGANTVVPDAAGVAPTAIENRQEMDTNSTKLIAIVADTNELQIDWVNGGRLDLLVDAIKAVTDLLPDAGALNDLAAILTDTGTTLDAKINDIQGATFNTTTDSLEAVRDRGDAAWTTGAGGSDRLLMVDTTIATLSSQTSFTLTSGSADNDAYNNCTIVIEDVSTSTQKAVGIVLDYVGSTKTITLKYDPAIFTMATTDKVYILAENALKASLANRQLNVAADGDLVEVNTLTGQTVQTADHTSAISTIDTVADAIKAITDLLPDAGALTTLITHLTDIKGAGFVGATDSNEAIRDRGDTAWITGGGGGITDILNLQPVIPTSIDLANTATARIGLMLTNALDDLPSTAEITPGTIDIDRKAIGGTSWSSVVSGAACSEQAGLIYFDEVFDSGSGYVEGDSIRITFKSQKITVAANDYEITDANGVMFQTEIRQTMVGTDSALLAASVNISGGVVESNLIQMGSVVQSATDLKDFADAGYDPAVNKVEGVKTADTTTTNTDMVTEPPTAVEIRQEIDSNSTKSGYALSATGADLILKTSTYALAIADAIWDEVINKAGHNVAGSAAKHVRELGVLVAAEGSVSGTPTTTVFTTDITGFDDNFFVDQVVSAYNGAAMAGQGRVIIGYNGTTGVITLDEPMTTALSSGDDIVIFAPHVHPISQIQSGLATEAKQDIIDTVVDGIQADLDNGADGLTALKAAITGLNDASVADILTTALTESYASDGATATLSQLLYMIWSVLNSLKFVSTTGTARKLDGATAAMTFTLDDATTPTDINRAS